ncbi:ABC transporter permease [Acidicapsa dinghuensis]|uniref:ABC transporter permease n=1 Tax=Acidicapsa dinghuensis TaxID=2218256 RepID=A0ABW1E8Q9_9BACT|nr:ABC transporter permease [Acidicapsa dinghuensis]
MGSDLKHAVRGLMKSPGFAIAAVLALALGIGANTAIFSVVNAVLLKPLSYPDAERIVEFGTFSTTLGNFFTSVPEFHAYQSASSVFSEVAAYDSAGPGFNLTGDHPEQIRGIHVTEGYFRLFGAPVIAGRTFTRQEDSPNGGKVVVLSYGLWQRRFAGDPAVVGKSLLLGNEPYTIVGVTGKDFHSDPQADIWLPFQFEPVTSDMNHYFQVAGLLRPGVTMAQAQAELKVAAVRYHREFPQSNQRQEFHIQPLRDSIVGEARKSLLVMLGAVSLVLLIACANVANLLLVRATARKREFAIRSALGAGHGRIVRQLLTESVLLSVAGGVLGMALGFAGVRALLAVSPAGLPRLGENGSAVGIDWRVLVFTLAVSLGTGILFGLFPAVTASRTDLNTVLKESAGRSGTGMRQGRVRALLVISEVSLALVLLIGAVLLIRTFAALHAVDPGFNAQNVLTMDMSLTGERYLKTAGVAQLSRNGRDRLNALPGVEVSAVAYWLPNHVGDALPFEIAGQPLDKDHEYGSRWMSVSPGYLDVFHIPVLRGRGFNENDTASAPGVMLVNEALAKRYWPGRDAVGQRIITSKGLGAGMNESTSTIVGVVGDTHNAGPGRPPDPMVMVPIAQVTDAYTISYTNVQPLFWVVRTRSDPHALMAAVTEQLRVASAGAPAAHMRTMDEVMGVSTAREQFNMLLLAIFGVVALALASIGIYGLMAYTVEQRSQEMGIRMALGADRVAIRGLVVWSGMRMAMAGIVVGMAAALGLTRLMSSFLFGVRPWDPVAFFAAPVILCVVALAAVWLPGVRASSVDPVQALRAE